MSEPHPSQRENPRADATAEARKKYDQAAFRAGMLFIVLPACLGPVLMILSTGHWLPHSLLLTVLISVGWIVLVCVSVAFGLFRIRKYKQDHPFEG